MVRRPVVPYWLVCTTDERDTRAAMSDIEQMVIADLQHAYPPPVIAVCGVPVEQRPKVHEIHTPTP